MIFDRILKVIFTATLFLVLALPIQADNSPGRPYVAGEVIVKYRKKLAPAEKKYSISTRHVSNAQTFARNNVQKIKIADDMTVDQAVDLYKADPDVLYAEPNYMYRLKAMPDDPQMYRLWGLANIGQVINGSSGKTGADLDAEQAWELETGSREIVVAVVDSGVDLSHPDLAANIWTNPNETINGFDDDGNGYIDDIHGWDFTLDSNDPTDTRGHGTLIAGILGAVGNNATGVSGVCWQVSIMPLRFITAADYGTVADAIEAIEYADAMGASVINLSWGGPDYSQALKDAIDNANALVVCAAGNEGQDLADTPTYPASYNSSNILSVAASDMTDAPAWFTNYSDTLVDVAAPGIDIFSTAPNRRKLFFDAFWDLYAWDADGIDGSWALQPIYNGSALTESPEGDYANNMETWIRLGPLDLSGITGSRLDFNITGDTADTGDRLYVEASNDGVAWSRLWMGLADGPTQSITGPKNQWQLVTADLKSYDGTPAFYLRLRFTSDASGVADGYSIDNLTITCADTMPTDGTYYYYQGTSMSAAYASGAAALIMAQKPSLTPEALKVSIESTVDPNPQFDGIVATAGRMNVYNALTYSQSNTSDDIGKSAATNDSGSGGGGCFISTFIGEW